MFAMEQSQDRTVCPVCGRGRLVDVTFDGGTGEREPSEEPKQRSDSSEVDVYSCGHEVPGARLDRADGSLDVERRTSDEPVVEPSIDDGRARAVDETS